MQKKMLFSVHGASHSGVVKLELGSAQWKVTATLKPNVPDLTIFIITENGLTKADLLQGVATINKRTDSILGAILASTDPFTILAQGACNNSKIDFERIKVELRLKHLSEPIKKVNTEKKSPLMAEALKVSSEKDKIILDEKAEIIKETEVTSNADDNEVTEESTHQLEAMLQGQLEKKQPQKAPQWQETPLKNQGEVKTYPAGGVSENEKFFEKSDVVQKADTLIADDAQMDTHFSGNNKANKTSSVTGGDNTLNRSLEYQPKSKAFEKILQEADRLYEGSHRDAFYQIPGPAQQVFSYGVRQKEPWEEHIERVMSKRKVMPSDEANKPIKQEDKAGAQAAVDKGQMAAATPFRDPIQQVFSYGTRKKEPWEEHIERVMAGRSEGAFHEPPVQSQQGEKGSDTGFREQTNIDNPFKARFPNSKWTKITFSGTSKYYLEGRVVHQNKVFHVTAMPGEYQAVNDMRKQGFTQFIRSGSGKGYWLKMNRIQ